MRPVLGRELHVLGLTAGWLAVLLAWDSGPAVLFAAGYLLAALVGRAQRRLNILAGRVPPSDEDAGADGGDGVSDGPGGDPDQPGPAWAGLRTRPVSGHHRRS